MFVRSARGNKLGVAIGIDNIYPGEAGTAGPWIQVDNEAYKDLINTLVERKQIEVYEGEGVPPVEQDSKPKTAGERAVEREAYKKLFKEQHWTHAVSYIKKQTSEYVLLDMLQAALDDNIPQEHIVVKTIRQKLEEAQR